MFSFYPETIFSKLEYTKILELLVKNCLSSLGKEAVESMIVHTEKSIIERLLEETMEFKKILQLGISFPTEHYHDITKEIQWLIIDNSVLTEVRVHRMQQMLLTVRHIYVWLKQHQETYPQLFLLLSNTEFEKIILQNIQTIIDENGTMRSNASKELSSIRVDITKISRSIDSKFKEVVTRYNREKWLADDIESVRNERRVLCAFAENKRKIKGIIHDESATGKTVYIEPIETIELSNDLVSLKIAEQREIARIMKELTDLIRPFVHTLEFYQSLLSKIDVTRAKALLAVELDATKPITALTKKTLLIEAYHPLLKIINKQLGKKIVPFNVELNSKNRLLLLSGSNAGGKTLCLKTFGLLQLMWQSGILVPVQSNAEFQIFNQLIVELGDEQSIENQLSTYSSKLKNMKYVVENADKNTLVLMDELGTGTDPSLGGAVAESVLEELLKNNSFGVMNTHYGNLKLFASEREGFLNGAMLFDMTTLQPLYQLQVGKAGSSYTFEMAQINGLQKHIIDRAKNKSNTDERRYDQVLAQLQLDKKEVSQLQNTLKQKVESYERRLKHLDTEEKKIEEKRKEQREKEKNKVYDLLLTEEKRFQALYQEFLKQIKTKESYLGLFEQIRKEKALLQKDLNIIQEKTNTSTKIVEPLKKGIWVKIENTEKVGEVVELRNKQVVVQFGDYKTQVSASQLIVVTKHAKEKIQVNSNTITKNLVEKRSTFDNQIDVRGMNLAECMEVISDFIDTAIVVMQYKLRIVHGKGTGTLRNQIRQQLGKMKSVKTFYSELDAQGGDGVTIVELK